MKTKDKTPWEGCRFGEAHNFSLRCAELRDSNPYKQPALEAIMTEWSRNCGIGLLVRPKFELPLNGRSSV